MSTWRSCSCTTRRFFVRRSNSAPHARRSAYGRSSGIPARVPTAFATFQIRWPVIRRSMRGPTLFLSVTTKSGAVAGSHDLTKPEVGGDNLTHSFISAPHFTKLMPHLGADHETLAGQRGGGALTGGGARAA